MELKAFSRTIHDMLTNKTKYIIPSFKKGYTWTINEVTELWHDIITNITLSNNMFITQEHFFGSIVLVEGEPDNKVLVIDGHQRLVTITILLSALVEVFKENMRADIAASLQSLIMDSQKVYKIQNEAPNSYLLKTIQSFNKVHITPEAEEDKNIKNAYDFFYNQLTSISISDLYDTSELNYCIIGKIPFLEAVRDQIFKLVMIYIAVSNENDAYTILGTLNAKASNLTSVDFIKSEVVRILNPKGLSREADEKWREIKHLLNSREEKNTPETFFTHYWPSKYEYVPNEKLYKSFKSHIPQNAEGISRFLDNLYISAKDYLVISDPLLSDFRQQEERGLFTSISALELFRALHTRILLLALFDTRRRNMITLNDFIKIINKLENYHFIATAVCGIDAPGIERFYSKNSLHLRNSTSLKETKDILTSLTIQLAEMLPDYETFKHNLSKIYFLDGKPRYKKLIQYIFRKWEAYLIATNELEMSIITLEHIMPQSTENPYVGMLGNLLPLAGQLNHTAGDKNFRSKMDLYKKSQFKTVNQFVLKYYDKVEWNEKDIQSRTNEIAKLLYYEIFRILG